MRTVIVVLCLLATRAQAEPWYRGEHGSNRILHMSLTVVGFALFPAETLIDVTECRWCSGPNAIDRGVRDALIWNATDSAAVLSDADAYALAPTLAAGLVFAGTLDTPSWALVIDDIVPIAESVMLTHWATTGLKVIFARERPNSHFEGDREGNPFLSFPSGHTSRAFAAVTSAAMIARMRHYKSEPYIWIAGMTLAALTGYLRIAADRHYFTDTLAGAVVGVSAGLTVPLLMRRSDVAIVVTGSEVAFAGHW